MVNPSGYTALDLVGYTDKGTYSASASYVKNDLVHYGGNIWRCLIDDTTGITPTEGNNWTLFIGVPTNMAERIIAPLEVSPSENAYSVGEQLIFNDVLYKAKTAIAVGDALVVGTNIELAPKITSQIQTLINETATINNVLGAKNILPNNATTQVINGVTFTVNSDGSVTANGTATASTLLPLVASFTVPKDGSYTLSGITPNVGDLHYGIIVYDVTNSNTAVLYIQNTQYTVETATLYSSHIYRAELRIFSGYTASNLTFYPMIRPASIIDDTYVPYAMTNQELTDNLKSELINVTFASGVTNSGNRTYFEKIGNEVFGHLAITYNQAMSGASTNVTVLNIPSEYIPKTNSLSVAIGSGCVFLLNARTDGTIQLSPYVGSYTANTGILGEVQWRI